MEAGEDTLRVLVTGASGFVGSAIWEACRSGGLTVRATGRRPVADPAYVPADVLEKDGLAHLVEGMDCIVHSAGAAHRFGRRAYGRDFFAANVRGVEHTLAAAGKAGVKHAVLISSVSVYGPHSGAVSETATCRPEGLYAQSKLVGELMARRISHEAGLRLDILRLATVYGEGDPGNIGRLMRAIDRRRFVWVGDGQNLKSLIHVSDVARACLAVVQSRGEGTRTFNVSAPPCTMQAVVQGLASALHRHLPPLRLPAGALLAGGQLALAASFGNPRAAAVNDTLAKWLADDVYDGSAFQAAFEFTPSVELAEGLARQVAAYRQERG